MHYNNYETAVEVCLDCLFHSSLKNVFIYPCAAYTNRGGDDGLKLCVVNFEKVHQGKTENPNCLCLSSINSRRDVNNALFLENIYKETHTAF